MKRRCGILRFFLLGLSVGAWAQEVGLLIPKTLTPPSIDGRIDPVWRMVAKNRMLTFVDGKGPGPWPDLFTQFRVLWDEEALYLLSEVVDERIDTHHPNVWERDGFEIYFDGDNSKNPMSRGYDENDIQWRFVYGELTGNPGPPHAVHAFLRTPHGFNLEIKIPRSDLSFDLESGHVFGHEWQYNDNDGGHRETIAKWWSSSDDSWRNPSLFGTAKLDNRVVTSLLDVRRTSVRPVVDGRLDACWETASVIPFNTYVEDWGPPVPSLAGWDDLDMTFRLLWDETNFFLFVSVIDDVVTAHHDEDHQNDGIEISFDGDNSKNDRSRGFDENDRRYAFVYGRRASDAMPSQAEFAWKKTTKGYDFELRLPQADVPFPLIEGHVFGFEVQVNDNDGTSREHVAKWWSSSDETWLNPSLFGTARLVRAVGARILLTSPQSGAVFFEGEEVPLHVETSGVEAGIGRVVFFVDDREIGSDAVPPYVLTWTAGSPGVHTLKAEAWLSTGTRLSSQAVSIQVLPRVPPAGSDTLLFSHPHGFYREPFNAILYSGVPDIRIRYTLDGSDPRRSKTAWEGIAPVVVRIDPSSTQGRGKTPGVTLRACAFVLGKKPTRPKTQTYLFLEAVKKQTYPGGGWPLGQVKGQIIDYDMDPRVVTDPRYRDHLDKALLDIPSFSIVTDLKYLFDPDSGIYVNAQFHGRAWERPCSVELIRPDGIPGFSTNAGLRIRGGWSRHGDNPKHAFRLFFRSAYGDGMLDYPLFEGEGVDRFDKIDLRTSQNYSWSFKGESGAHNTMNRDVFSRDLQGELGHPYTRSRYYHLYLNGLYMGLFQTQERSEASWAQSYLGGNREEWDVIKVDIGEYWEKYDIEATDGNLDAWRQVWEACQRGFENNAAYFRLQGKNPDGTPNPAYPNLVDIDNLIDYMLIIFYTGNFDAPVSKFRENRDPNNFFALRRRTGDRGFIFLTTDSEHSLLKDPGEGVGIGLYENRVALGYPGGEWMWVDRFEKFHPQWLHFKLAQNAEYRMRFADHAFRHLFHGGAMTPQRSITRFRKRADEIQWAIIAESARWGDSKWYRPRTKDDDWIPAVQGVIEGFFPRRTDIVIGQLKAVGLYPNLDPPQFVIQGTAVWNSHFLLDRPVEVELQLPSGQSGTIYYTLDGTDPRAIGGLVAPRALRAANRERLLLDRELTLAARVRSGNVWSAIHTLTVVVPRPFDVLKITELHYHPLPEGGVAETEFEFVELKNIGHEPFDLSGYAFIDGIQYTFSPGSWIEGRGFLVLASNAARFESRYGFRPFGEFGGQLSNAGERITLVTASGDTVFSFVYDDDLPWPTAPDGKGYSLVSVMSGPTGSPENPRYWMASREIHGSPARDDAATRVDDRVNLPERFILYQNMPNPFNPITRIRFELPKTAFVILSVYDILGRQVDVLVHTLLEAGSHTVLWDGSRFSGGVYVVELRSEDFAQRRKMLLIK